VDSGEKVEYVRMTGDQRIIGVVQQPQGAVQVTGAGRGAGTRDEQLAPERFGARCRTTGFRITLARAHTSPAHE
jgi:hypothetical protein